ncbi:hypothetical protein ACFO3A_01115 [Comamonas nitrativorans]|uniref:YCII-related domain-containing protein n=1 Tax=Comamonas nitrativorans TaxID=108437 RepID=A0ABV9GS44_9BURK
MKRHILMGRSFIVVAEFPDTDEGTRAANAHMEANPGVGVLAVTCGRIVLADKKDKGSPTPIS